MSSLPPGPRSTLLTTLAVARQPYEALRDLRQRHGDPFLVPSINGRIVTTAEPELIRELFTEKDLDLFVPFGSEAIAPFFGRNSLLMMYGEPHRRERKLLTPPFHGERMRAYGETIASATRAAFQSLASGQPFTALEIGQRISLEVIIRAVFGVEDAGRVLQHGQALTRTLDAALPIFMFARALQKAPFGLGPWARYLRASAHANALLREQIERVRPDAHARHDILSGMLSARYEDGEPMSDEHVIDELRTLLIAGHETTAITLAWALELVHRDREVLARLLAELDAAGDSPDELARLPWLGAIVDETLRLRPVVEVVFRKLARPWRFGGHDLPAGMSIAAAVVLVHMRDDLYPEPGRFSPARMLERRPGPFEYLPFGGGHRRCIGAAFALYEARIVLATALREWTLALREPRPVAVARRSVTLGPKTGVRMTMVGPRGG